MLLDYCGDILADSDLINGALLDETSATTVAVRKAARLGRPRHAGSFFIQQAEGDLISHNYYVCGHC